VFVDKKIPQKLRIKKDDILICARNGSKHLVGKNILLDENLIDSTFGAFMTIFRSEYANFISKILNSQIFKSQTGLYSTTTINQLTTSILNNIVVAFTKNEIERNQIAEFLDKQTTQFDELIAISKVQITLLEEKRQATITQAVTKGLDPSVAMKDSGVEWIGEIPEGWEVKKLKHSVDLFSKKSNGNANERPYVGLEHIESKTGRLIPDFPMMFEEDSKEFNSGDVLFGKLRPYLAKAILADFAGICSGELLVLRGNEIKPDLLHRLVLSDGFIQLVNSATYGVKMPRAEWSMIGDIFIPIPKEEKEQIQIIAFLKKQTTQFNELIAKSKTQITLLEEKKQALITAAVTGKIDVRSEVVA
jgi:type I restriction enzyme S subunit